MLASHKTIPSVHAAGAIPLRLTKSNQSENTEHNQNYDTRSRLRVSSNPPLQTDCARSATHTPHNTSQLYSYFGRDFYLNMTPITKLIIDTLICGVAGMILAIMLVYAV